MPFKHGFIIFFQKLAFHSGESSLNVFIKYYLPLRSIYILKGSNWLGKEWLSGLFFPPFFFGSIFVINLLFSSYL